MALSIAVPITGHETENFSMFNNSFGLIDFLGLSHSSPSPSVSSDSSGIGSLGSLKSESINSDSLPSSPQTTDKKIFVVPGNGDQLIPDYGDIKVMYGGRDILNLSSAVNDQQWNYRPAFLPANNPAFFFANRSQYHRLGPYGLQSEYSLDKCKSCGFHFVVAQNHE